MTLLSDLHHVAFLTADMDRLIAFYKRVFDARVTVDLVEEDRRRGRGRLEARGLEGTRVH